MTGLKQRDVLLPLFNIALGKVVRSVQEDNWGIVICTKIINILGFVDDLNIIGNNEESIKQNNSTLNSDAKVIGLTQNNNKTKVMELLPTNNHASNAVIQRHI